MTTVSFTFKWEFFLTSPIWGRTVFCIDIGKNVYTHMVKVNLPHMYMFSMSIKKNSDVFHNARHRSLRFDKYRCLY